MRKRAIPLYITGLVLGVILIHSAMRFYAALPRSLGMVGGGPIEFSRDSRSILSASYFIFDRFDLTEGKWQRGGRLTVPNRKEDGAFAQFYTYAGAPDGRSGLFASSIGTLLFQSDKTSLQQAWPEAQAPVYAVAISPDGRLMAGGHRLAVWTTRTQNNYLVPGQVLWKEASAVNPAAVLRFSPRGTSLAVGYFNGRVEVKDASTGKTLWTTKTPKPFSTRGFSYFARDPLGKPGNLHFYKQRGMEQFYFPMVFLSQERLAYSNGRATFVCDSRTGKVLHTIPRTAVFDLASVHDGKTLVVAGCAEECDIELWDAVTGSLERVLLHSHRAFHLAVSPDQKYNAALEEVNGNETVDDQMRDTT
jgi:WD40 repeat protein